MRFPPSFAPALALLLAAFSTGSCSGPEAPDWALCQDVIVRVCRAPRCEQVSVALSVGDDCEAVTSARTGCIDEAFLFVEPMTRARFLECRLPLIRGGNDIDHVSSCADIEEAFNRCAILPAFLKGGLR